MFDKFKKLFGSNEMPEKNIDRSLGYSRFNEFQNYLSQKKFDKLQSEYESLTWDGRSLLNESIGLEISNHQNILKWVEYSKDSYIANLFAGVSHTALAWEARTAALAKNVSKTNAELFIEHLEDAHQYLLIADELNPEDAEICARMIRVCMGLSIEEEDVYTYFNAAKDIQTDHLFAHLMMINYLNPKWSGSLEKMHAFADMRYKESNNSLLVALKLFAVVEEWLYYKIIGEAEKSKSYFQNPELKNDVFELYKNYKESESGKLLVPYVRNYFAFLLFKLEEKDMAREEIKKIPGQIVEYPWTYIGVDSNRKLQSL